MKKNERNKSKGLPFLQNRDQSWLRFNFRVLEEAQDQTVPLLERLKFLSIYQSNLQEFFMIRVGSLKDVLIANPHAKDTRTLLPLEHVIKQLYRQANQHIPSFQSTFKDVVKGLENYGIKIKSWKQLTAKEIKEITPYIEDTITPLLSPQIIDVNHPFPSLNSGQLYLGLNLKRKEKEMMGLLPIPLGLPAYVTLPGKPIKIILIEHIIEALLESIFNGYKITEKMVFYINRNGDLNWDEQADAFYDARMKVKKLLSVRNRQSMLRLVMDRKISSNFLELLLKRTQIKEFETSVLKTPLNLSFVFQLEKQVVSPLKDRLTFPSFVAKNPVGYLGNVAMKEQLFKRDMMVYYPYQSINPFLRWLKEAALDPECRSIKITLYRLGKTAKLVEYLSLAAENGKDVLVVIELRARFDEKNNIDWSERLEQAGCRIIYGLDYLKIHSKLCVITYQHKGKTSFITQIGTGNYNERTVELYTDLSLMTSNEKIGLEAITFFQSLSLNSPRDSYSSLVVSPFHLKQTFLQLIEQEKAKASRGRIRIKCNSLTDNDFSIAFAEASKKGVPIDLNIRGICCLLPNVPGWTETIRVHSVVGRFLEHGRVYVFGDGEDAKVFIASADLMTRNTERRMEVGVEIIDASIKKQLIAYVDFYMNDSVKGRMMSSKGDFIPILPSTTSVQDVQNQLLYHEISSILKA